VLQACDRVLVQIDDPDEQSLAEQIATAVCQALVRFEVLFGRRQPGPIRLRIVADMAAWRSLSGRAWYIAAVLKGDQIVLQPGRSLRMLAAPARPAVHELAHLFIRRAAGRGCPRWLDEGLAQRLAGDLTGGDAPANLDELAALERRLRGPDSDQTQRKRDYRSARALVDRLLAGTGERVLVEALPKLRAGTDPLCVQIAGKRLRELLFTP